MKNLLLLMALFICAMGASAQSTKVITGAVIDKNGNPLPNALVEATGGAESVTTDADGTFRIEVPIWLKSLTASYAGLEEKKIKLSHNNQVIFEMKPKTSSWFIDASYSINFGDFTFNRLGIMGGYLGNWGGYAKVMMPIGADDAGTCATVGVIKRIASPLYLYLGAGYAGVLGYDEYYSSYDGWYSYEYDDAGIMADFGVIFKFNKINFNIGYSFSYGFEFVNNHSIQLSVGYCF